MEPPKLVTPPEPSPKPPWRPRPVEEEKETPEGNTK